MDGIMREELRKAWGYPLRQAVFWTKAEDLQALTAFDMGVSIEDIADDHQRSVGGISARLLWMVECRAKGSPPSPRTTADEQARHYKNHSNKTR